MRVIDGRARVASILFVLLCLCGGVVRATDKDTSGVRSSKDLGLYIGGAYSLGRMESRAIEEFNASPKLSNSAGLLAGFCYNFYVGKKSIVRPGVEAFFLPMAIVYPASFNKTTERQIFPMTAEFPISWIYSSFRTKSFPRPEAKPEFGLTLRPVFAVKALSELQPVLRSTNFNTDIFVGYPIANNKSVMRVELYYSHGWLNLIGSDTNSEYTSSISNLQRHVLGVRCIFH
jgi:hypothetical protein